MHDASTAPTLEINSINPPSPGRILVVDDEPGIRTGIELSLVPEGYVVEPLPSGDEAIDRLLNHPEKPRPDAMILDLRMPGSSGIEVIRTLVESQCFISTVISSAYIDTPTAIEAMELGVVDFLKKPITPSELRGAVKKLLEEERRLSEVAYTVEMAMAAAADPASCIEAVRSCIRQKRFRHASRLIQQAPAFSSHRAETDLWKTITSHIVARHENRRGPAEDATMNSLYQSTNLVDLLAYRE